MASILKKTKVVDCPALEKIPEEILSSSEPLLIKGMVKDWTLVKLGLQSNRAAIDYLKKFYNGKHASVYFGEPSINGRFFYKDNAAQLNFETHPALIDEMLDNILAHIHEANPPAFYVASTSVDGYFPGLQQENNLDACFSTMPLEKNDPMVSLWIGNYSLVSCHYDAPKNLACCVAGKRRFTLFPPEQIHNLYPGPLELTPGGQAVSMVDFKNPDFEKYPRFRDALAAGQIAEMEPGDALYLPNLWWHQVEGLSPFNILLNYWWNTAPKYMGTAMNVLYHALLSIKDRPVDEKQAWKAIFDYYIFNDTDHAGEHLPEAARGFLGPLDDTKARMLRAQLINKLNR